jgi:hypothetical protein
VRINTFIRYIPRRKGFSLAFAYGVIAGKKPGEHVYCGYFHGYAGGGAYDDNFFRAIAKGRNFTSCVYAAGTWEHWIVGPPDPEGLELYKGLELFSPDEGQILWACRERLERWFARPPSPTRREDGLGDPELRKIMRKRLRRLRDGDLCYQSSRLNYELLGLVSRHWGLSLRFDFWQEWREGDGAPFPDWIK